MSQLKHADNPRQKHKELEKDCVDGDANCIGYTFEGDPSDKDSFWLACYKKKSCPDTVFVVEWNSDTGETRVKEVTY